MGNCEHQDDPSNALLPTCLNGVRLTFSAVGQVDQLEDRYLGMVEASGSNPDLSILVSFPGLNSFEHHCFGQRLILPGNPAKE